MIKSSILKIEMRKLSKVILGFLLAGCTMGSDKLPERYVGQITQEEYDIVITCSKKNFIQQHGTVEKIEDGIIYVDLNKDVDNLNQLGLDNLIRYCRQEEDKAKWKEIIEGHFGRLFTEVDFDKSDFDNCREFLSLRIYPEYDDKIKDVMTYKIDFPGTMTALVLNLPDKYESIDKETVDMWKIPIDSLFYIAQENVNKLEVEVNHIKASEAKIIYSFFSLDHSASFIRDIENNADFAIGKFGSFVAIPSTGSVFVAPIVDESSIDMLDKLIPMTNDFFNEDPGNLTTDIFWYYNNKFELLPVANDRIEIPKELKTRLR